MGDLTFMKNIFILFIFLLLFSCGIYVTDKNNPKTNEQSDSKEKAIITDNNVRMRNSPSIDSSIVTLLDKDTVVDIIGISEEKVSIPSYQPNYWYNVRKDDGKEGWVFGGLLAVDDSSISAIIDKSSSTANNKISPNKNESNNESNIDKKNFVWKESVSVDSVYIKNFVKNDRYFFITRPDGISIFDKSSGKIKWQDKIADYNKYLDFPSYIYSNDDVFIYLNPKDNKINIIDLKKTDEKFKNVKREKISFPFDIENILPYFGFNNNILYFFVNRGDINNVNYELITMTLKGKFESKLKIDYRISDVQFELNNGVIFILSSDGYIYKHSI